MSLAELIEQELQRPNTALLQRFSDLEKKMDMILQSAKPKESEYITIEEIAGELGYSVRHSKERVVNQTDFPKRIRVSHGHYLWFRAEFRAWMRARQDKR